MKIHTSSFDGLVERAGVVSDEDLYEHIWTQLAELDDPGPAGISDPSDEMIETALAVPAGVSDEQFSRVLSQVESDRDRDDSPLVN
jgi:hypothetical protein